MPGACREPPRRHEGELTVGPAVELRAGHAGDVPQLCVLAMHVYVATYCEGGLRPDQAREALEVYSVADFQFRLQSGHTFTLACHGEHLLGFKQDSAVAGVRGRESTFIHPSTTLISVNRIATRIDYLPDAVVGSEGKYHRAGGLHVGAFVLQGT